MVIVSDVWIGPKQTAELCGVSLWCVYNWAKTGDGPPVYRINGTRFRYRPRDIEAWIEEQRVK